MTTYLLNMHYTLPLLALAQTFSSAVELASTSLMPWAVSLISSPSIDSSDPLSRVGLWGLSWQYLALLPTICSLLLLPTSSPTPASSYPVLTATFFISLALSRLGMWTYSLVTQTLVQIAVPKTQRLEFSGIEVSFVSAAEVARWGATAVWSRPDQFKGVAAAEMVVVPSCTFFYWVWTRRAGNHPDPL